VNRTEPGHLNDVALLAIVHNEWGEEGAGPARHVLGCDPCTRRFDALHRQDALIGALLESLDHAPPPLALESVRRPRVPAARRGLIAAALAALLATAAAAAVPASPLHQWLRRTFAPAPAREAPTPPTVAPAPPAQNPDAAAGVAVPTSGTLDVVLRRAQTGGAIELAIQPGDAIIRARGGDVAYVVGAARVTIDNRTPADLYLLTVPPTVRRLTIVAGEREVFRLTDGRATPGPSGAGGVRHVRIPLDGSAPAALP